MKPVRIFLFLLATALASVAHAEAPAPATPPADAQQAANTTNAAAAVTMARQPPNTPDFLEHLVDEILRLFDVRSSENTMTHYVIAAVLLVGAILLRRIVVTFLF